MKRCSSADKCFSSYLEKRSDVNTAFDRMEDQSVKCGYGQNGVCCRLCSNGPCRITPDSPKGVCGATADTMVARNFLRAVAAGSACYLHVAESTATRLKSIASGKSPLSLRSEKSADELASKLGIICDGSALEKAGRIADYVLSDIYGTRSEKMSMVEKLAIAPRVKKWKELGIMPGGAKAEVFDAIVKTSTNLNTDAVDQLLHCLKLGICTGLYGLGMTNHMNDIIMGEPEITTVSTGFSVANPDYINIAVSGHSHSVFAGLIAFLESEKGQGIGKKAGAKGIKLVGITCVGQDMQLRGNASRNDVFAGQAGNNFTQEGLLATGAIDMVISEFNCTLSGIEPIAEKNKIKLLCLDDVCKQSSAEFLEDKMGSELVLAERICKMAAEQYVLRRGTIKIDVPTHGYDDVVAGISEKSLVKLLGGSLSPLIDLIKNGVIKGVAGILGCSNLAAGGHDTTTVELTRQLIKRDILVLSAGCTTGGLANCGFCSPSAKEMAGPGLKLVCEKLGIPPVLNFGPCLAIGRIEIVVAELAKALNVDIPQLPVVISAPQWLEEQALADGCYGLALGLTLHLAQPPPILGSPLVTRILTQDLVNLTGGKVIVEMDPVLAADKLQKEIEKKLAALGIGV